jgi:hypothetical protein
MKRQRGNGDIKPVTTLIYRNRSKSSRVRLFQQDEREIEEGSDQKLFDATSSGSVVQSQPHAFSTVSMLILWGSSNVNGCPIRVFQRKCSLNRVFGLEMRHEGGKREQSGEAFDREYRPLVCK